MRVSRILLSLSFLCLYSLSAHAQCPGQTVAQEPFAKEKLTIGATANGLTASIYQQAALAMVQVQAAPIAYALVGTPTTADDMTAGIGTFPICGLASIRAFKAVRLVSTDAVLVVTYYRSRQP